MKAVSREYWSDSSDPHKVGPIRVTLSEGGLSISWVGDARPIVALKPEDLVDLASVEAAESDLRWLREEAKAALDDLKLARDEMRSLVRVVRGETESTSTRAGSSGGLRTLAALALLFALACGGRTPSAPPAEAGVPSDTSEIIIDCWKDGGFVPCEAP